MVNTELYRNFIAIYRAGTISKAAVLCDITQPAASQQLASLERSLNVKLFERTPREMVATNDGHELYTKVADSFDWLDFVSQDFILQRQEEEALLRIGVPLSFFTNVIASKVLALPFRLDVHFGTTKELSDALINGKLELLVSEGKVSKSSIHSELLDTQAFLLVGSRDIDAPEQGFLQWQNVRAWVRKQNWISYDAELTLVRKHFKAQYDLQPNIEPKCIVPDFNTILEMLRQGKGVSILPEYLCAEAIKKEEITLLHRFDIDNESNMFISYESSAKNNVLIKKFRESILTA